MVRLDLLILYTRKIFLLQKLYNIVYIILMQPYYNITLKNQPIDEARKFADFLEIELDDEKKEKIQEFILPDFSSWR